MNYNESMYKISGRSTEILLSINSEKKKKKKSVWEVILLLLLWQMKHYGIGTTETEVKLRKRQTAIAKRANESKKKLNNKFFSYRYKNVEMDTVTEWKTTNTKIYFATKAMLPTKPNQTKYTMYK